MKLALQQVLSLVRSAGAAAKAERTRGLTIATKAKQDFVTQADHKLERQLRAGLVTLLPGSGCLGEEDGGERDASVLWIVDPIDGTTNFIRGIPYWCVSIGLLVDGVAEVGVIFAPELDRMYVARRGQGVEMNGRTLRRRPVEAGSAVVNVGQSFRQSPEIFGGIIAGLREAHLDHRVLGSGALGLAMTASGEVDAAIEGDIQPWDVAAGMVIAQEAGCIVSDYFAGKAVPDGNPTVAAAPGLEDAVFPLMETAIGALIPRLPAR